jgi:hypothetical protein
MVEPVDMRTAVATEKPPLVRTDFTNDAAWQEIVAAVTTPSEEGFLPLVSIVNDSSFDGTSPENVAAAVSDASDHALLFVVDQMAISHPDHPILCIELPMSGKSLRAIPAVLWSIENNLSLANMDFEEFSDAADANGIFRGFV